MRRSVLDKSCWLSICAVAAWTGCSSVDDSTLDVAKEDNIAKTQAELNEAALASLPKLDGQQQLARIIESIEFENTTVRFVEIPGVDANGKAFQSIFVDRSGPLEDGDIISKLNAAAGVVLTSAELHVALGGGDDIPPELEQDHSESTALSGRTGEFLRLDAAEVERGTPRPKSLTLGQFQGVMYAFIPGKTHTNIHTESAGVSGGGIAHTCSEVETTNFAAILSGDGLQKSDCNNVYFSQGTVHHGIANSNSTGTQIPSQWCAGYRNLPDWFCVPAILLGQDQFQIIDSLPAAVNEFKAASFTVSSFPAFLLWAGNSKITP